MIIAKLLILAAGVWIVAVTIQSAVQSFVLPRSAPDALTRFIFRRMRRLFDLILKLRRADSYAARDRIMAFYAPYTLLLMPGIWLLLVTIGFAFIYFALGIETLDEAFRLSGSSLLTLGFVSSPDFLLTLLNFSQSVIGLGLIALLIAYLPTMYSAFAKRETAVAMLEVRAGSPPTAIELILRYHRLRDLGQLNEIWSTWEVWFAEVEESHTSLAALNFFRSPVPERSWITAAGAVLDTASIVASTIDQKRDVRAEICIRSGFIALRRIADFFRIPYDPDPAPTDPISVTREEFDEVYERLAAEGVALKPDRDQCWRDFAGWRVNYDTVLLTLAALTLAPYAPWISDRSFLPVRPRNRLWDRIRRNGGAR